MITSNVPFIVVLPVVWDTSSWKPSILTLAASITAMTKASIISPYVNFSFKDGFKGSGLAPSFSICCWHKGLPIADILSVNALFLLLNCLRKASLQRSPNLSTTSSSIEESPSNESKRYCSICFCNSIIFSKKVGCWMLPTPLV